MTTKAKQRNPDLIERPIDGRIVHKLDNGESVCSENGLVSIFGPEVTCQKCKRR